MYLPSSQLSRKPTTAQIRAAIWEATNLAAGRSSTGKPGAPLSGDYADDKRTIRAEADTDALSIRALRVAADALEAK